MPRGKRRLNAMCKASERFIAADDSADDTAPDRKEPPFVENSAVMQRAQAAQVKAWREPPPEGLADFRGLTVAPTLILVLPARTNSLHGEMVVLRLVAAYPTMSMTTWRGGNSEVENPPSHGGHLGSAGRDQWGAYARCR
jgi:hypothetical protein